MKTTLILLCLLTAAFPLVAQEGPVGIDGIETGVSTGVPLSDFADVASFGIGAQVRVPIIFRGLPGLVVRPQTAVLFYFSPLANVSGILTLRLDATAGWAFRITDGIAITPTLGYGALFHLALADSPLFFVDSGFTVAVEGSFAVTETIALYVEPGYQFFLEKDALSHQLLINAGVKFSTGGNK